MRGHGNVEIRVCVSIWVSRAVATGGGGAGGLQLANNHSFFKIMHTFIVTNCKE
jgi:hypothetical protein